MSFLDRGEFAMKPAGLLSVLATRFYSNRVKPIKLKTTAMTTLSSM